MQCRLPRKNVPNKKSNLTWYFNETISWSAAATYPANFTCNGKRYDKIGLTHSANPSAKSYIGYHDLGTSSSWLNVAELHQRSDPPFQWYKEVYRTITFDAPPTGYLLTWLEANATPQ